MHAYIHPTDFDWFTFLARRREVDEVNFWKPSAKPFKAIQPGAPFFFKLKAPKKQPAAGYNFVVGFGYFARYVVAPISVVWEAFLESNGAPSLSELRRQTSGHRTPRPRPLDDYPLGCILLTQPVFFPRECWIPPPRDFPITSPIGTGIDVSRGEGEILYRRCMDVARQLRAGPSLPARENPAPQYEPRTLPPGGYGAPQLVRPRLGQGTFHLSLVDAYGRAGAVSNEHSLPVLEAAHIRPFSDVQTHTLDNGLLLRTDIHRLFDKGYVTVDLDYKFVVSKRLREDFSPTRFVSGRRRSRAPALRLYGVSLRCSAIDVSVGKLVGARGFEPPASCSQSRRTAVEKPRCRVVHAVAGAVNPFATHGMAPARPEGPPVLGSPRGSLLAAKTGRPARPRPLARAVGCRRYMVGVEPRQR
jgi:putative restriction endonuclease